MAVATDTGLSSAILQQLDAVFHGYPEIDKVLIYGSRAKGTYRPASDIDLAVFASRMNSTRFSQLWSELDDLPLIFTLDLVHWDSLSNPQLKKKITEEGKPLTVSRPGATWGS